MAQLIVRNIEESLKAGLKRRARRHRHSMEEEAREILRNALKDEERPEAGLGTRIHRLFTGFGWDAEIAKIPDRPIKPAQFKR